MLKVLSTQNQERDYTTNTVLLTENPNEKVPYNTNCKCNPTNGGSGICGCTMGNELVDKKPKTNISYYTTTTFGHINEDC